MLLVQQDKQVDKVSGTIVVLHQMGQDIGVELDEQNKYVIVLLRHMTVMWCRIIEDIDEDMQRTETRISALTKRVNKAIRKSSGKHV